MSWIVEEWKGYRAQGSRPNLIHKVMFSNKQKAEIWLEEIRKDKNEKLWEHLNWGCPYYYEIFEKPNNFVKKNREATITFANGKTFDFLMNSV